MFWCILQRNPLLV